MGVRGELKIHQYLDFNVDRKLVKMMEITFRTEKTEGEFTLSMLASEFTAERARELAEKAAEEIDKAVG